MTQSTVQQAENAPVPSPSLALYDPLQAYTGAREYLRIPEICFTVVYGTAQSAQWSAGSLIVVEVPQPQGATGPAGSLWFLNLYADGADNNPSTIDLCHRPWIMHLEEEILMLAFELGDTEESAIRIFVKAQSTETFTHLINFSAYVKFWYA